MKKLQILITIAFILSIISLSVYAEEPNFSSEPKAGIEQSGTLERDTEIFKDHEKQEKCDKCGRNPLQRLEDRKENIQKEYKEGKITKEKADELTERIDKHIEKVKEFNSLSLPQKKEHLSAKFRSHVERNILDGKITKEEGEKIIKDFTNELEKWDGKEFPKFIGKDDKHKK